MIAADRQTRGPWSEGQGSHLSLFCIHEMNQMNSHTGPLDEKEDITGVNTVLNTGLNIGNT